MREEIKDGKTIMVFDDPEEMQWYFHNLLCHGPKFKLLITYLHEHCSSIEDANKALELWSIKPMRVRTFEEWKDDLENLPIYKLPEWAFKLFLDKKIPYWLTQADINQLKRKGA